MSDKMRWRYGEPNPVVAAVDSATVIEIGDLLWLDTDDAKPASSFSGDDAFDEFHHQQNFAGKFLGVAEQRSVAGDTTPIRVATTGVFEFNCPSGTYELGDLVGVRCITTVRLGDSEVPEHKVLELANQEVEKVAGKYAVARVAKREPVNTIHVLIAIRSTVMTGGILQRP